MTPDRLPLQYVDIFPPEQQADGAWVYEANPHGRSAVHYVDGPVMHNPGSHFGYSVPVEPVGVPPLWHDIP